MLYNKPSIKLSNKEKSIVNKIIDSGWYCLGEYTQKLEDYFCEEYNVKYAIACANATSGLVNSIKAAHLQFKTIALPSFTWPSTLYSLDCNSCSPVFVDIDINTWCMLDTPEFVIKDRVITNQIDGIISVDTFGNRSNIKSSVPVIYDAAHGFGIEDLGNRGLAEVVSFSFTKQISGMQGGIILTNDSIFADEVREYTKLSAKMLEISAFCILSEIKKYKKKIEIRDRIIKKYLDNLEVNYKTQQFDKRGNISTFCILLDNRDTIYSSLKENNIETKIYYKPLISGLTNTDYIYNRIISLPVYEEMEDKVEFICETINSCVN